MHYLIFKWNQLQTRWICPTRGCWTGPRLLMLNANRRRCRRMVI